MPQFFIKNDQIKNDRIHITGDEARHILKVLRLKDKDSIRLFTANGTRYDSVITHHNRHELFADIRFISPPAVQYGNKIILAQSVLKSKKMDTVIHKSIELGAAGIIPFVSSRTIPRWNRETAAAKTAHWQNIITAAVKQSGIRSLPAMEPIVTFNELMGLHKNMHRIILYENETQNSLKKILATIQFPAEILIATGPEGGFSKPEVSLARENGFQPAGLGRLILRSETVPITVLSILHYASGEMDNLKTKTGQTP